MHKTFSFKLYRSEKNRYLHRQIEIAASIWNRCIALHKRYYRLYGKSLNKYRLQKHLTKLKHRPRFKYWNELGSQAVQDITDRIDRAYTLFFRNRKTGIKPAPPGFRPRRKYRSFTLKQAGWALQGENRVRIGRQIFRFSKSREIEGTVKTVTLKRDPLGDLYVFFCCEVEDRPNTHVTTGKIAGADFGLKDFLRFSDGSREVSPLFYREARKTIRGAAKKLSSKQKGSNNRRKARTALARVHKRIADKRRDHHFKLAKKLALRYDYLFLEDLNLKDRHWRCVCGAVHDRDHNAALNILREGASSLGLGNIRPSGAVAV